MNDKSINEFLRERNIKTLLLMFLIVTHACIYPHGRKADDDRKKEYKGIPLDTHPPH